MLDAHVLSSVLVFSCNFILIYILLELWGVNLCVASVTAYRIAINRRSVSYYALMLLAKFLCGHIYAGLGGEGQCHP